MCNKKNSKWKQVVAETEYEVEIIKDNLNESEANQLELSLILDPKPEWQLTNVTKKSTKVKRMDICAISEYLSYSEESPTGLIWKHAKSRRLKNGDTAGSLKYTQRGTPHKCVVLVRGQMLSAHRVVYFLHNPDHDQNLVVNHKDCDPFNNKIENLELVSKAENNRKTSQQVLLKPRSNNTSGFVGVNYDRKGGYVVAYFKDAVSGLKRKYFSVKKLGYQRAFDLAIEWRTLNNPFNLN